MLRVRPIVHRTVVAHDIQVGMAHIRFPITVLSSIAVSKDGCTLFERLWIRMILVIHCVNTSVKERGQWTTSSAVSQSTSSPKCLGQYAEPFPKTNRRSSSIG